MHGDLRFAEDLPQLAAEAADVARRLCGSCQNLHLLWPYLRLAGASEGGRVGERHIHHVVQRLGSGDGRKFLIAGAADSGLLAVMARAVSPGTSIVVLDRCETPLELCRRFAKRWSLPIETLHVDLMQFSLPSAFDIVLAHSLLQFIPADRCVDVLSQLRRSLRPNGRLVILFRTSARIEGSLLPEYRQNYPTHLIKRLDRTNIALPEPREKFRRRLEIYAEERRAREGAHTSRSEVEQLIEAAGFAIESVTAIESNLSAPFQQLTAKVSKQHYLAVAKARD